MDVRSSGSAWIVYFVEDDDNEIHFLTREIPSEAWVKNCNSRSVERRMERNPEHTIGPRLLVANFELNP